nr:LysR substrate-binding domain-containing protein [Rhodoferax sp. AJA081-3]
MIYTIAPTCCPTWCARSSNTRRRCPDAAGELHRQADGDAAHRRDRLRHPGRALPRCRVGFCALYDEPFLAAIPMQHTLAAQTSVTTDELKKETMLLLGNGHCFRDHVLEVCPEFARFSSDTEGIRKSFEGSSLETIKHMVAAGMGITLVPRLSVPSGALVAKTRRHADSLVKYLPIDDGLGASPFAARGAGVAPQFHPLQAIAALRNAIYACELPGVKRLS